MRLTIFICLSLFTLIQHAKAQNMRLVDPKATKETKLLYKNLKKLAGKAVLFGHQDDMAYGIGWRGIKNQSDVKLSTGSYPAVFGWDLGGVEIDAKTTIDSIPFDEVRQHVLDVYKMGGVNTFSWHVFNPVTGKSSWDDTKEPNKTVSQIIPGGEFHENYIQYLDKISVFLASLKTDKGIYVPILFRPYHENDGNWFWWGGVHSAAKDFKALYSFTVDYLINKKGLHHLIYVYSPDRKWTSEADFAIRYPGGKFVDVIGMDDYYSTKDDNFLKLQVEKLEIMGRFAKKENKLSAFTETGCEGIVDKEWYTKKLLPCLKANEFTKQISWVMVWRNANTKHCYVPYPSHPAVADFLLFKKDPFVLFLDNIPALYK